MHGRASPTARQIYALAAALCERTGEEFPQTRAAASATIERLRIENGHSAPLEEAPLVHGRARRRGRRNRDRADELASVVAARLTEELK
jgi:hypothetical protein